MKDRSGAKRSSGTITNLDLTSGVEGQWSGECSGKRSEKKYQERKSGAKLEFSQHLKFYPTYFIILEY